MAAIEVINLTRRYVSRSGVVRRTRSVREALCGVSFSVGEGELFGLLGPNGAGKTTTIKILTTLLLPSSGSATVLGLDAARDVHELRPRIGYVFGGDRGLYDRLSALDNLRYFADLYRVSRRVRNERIAELVERVGLTGRERERVETYSRGMRQRLHIARGLLHDPPVVFLDEPTIGLDPLGAREIRELVKTLQREGKTILLTTHYMFEADDLCDRLAIINDGRIVATGQPADLKQLAGEQMVIEIETFGGAELSLTRVRDIAGVRGVRVEQRDQREILTIDVSDAALMQPVLAALDTRTGRVSVREPTLEDAYIRILSAP